MSLLDKDGRRARGDCWNTPQHYIDALLRLWPKGIDLDPCSNTTSLVPARERYMLPDRNGFSAPWAGKVFCNPPWSDPAPWYSRAATAPNAETVMLTHVATGSKWWQRYVWPCARAVCFHSPRLAFLDENGTPIKGNPRDCASTYYGPNVRRFEDVFSRLGHVVIL